ncbi:aminotransferase class I/II-fold pyridoxal phosphate-dependent enzyme, partial [Anaerosporobacter sp.]
YNLSVGTPDFKPPEHIIEEAIKAVAEPENYKYSLTDSDEMLQAVVDYYQSRYSTKISKDEVTSVHGTQEGMGHLGMAMCNPGDIVLLPDPGYPIFEAGSYLGQADIRYYPLVEENEYLPVIEDIPEEILYKTKYIVLSYPSNPVGAVAPKSLYEKMIQYAKKYGFFIINDNAYSDIIFDGREGFSFLSIEGAKDVGVEFFSLSKSFNVTGFRISFCIGNSSIVNALKKLRSQYDFGMSYPAQKVAIAALTGPRDCVINQCAEYQRRRDALCGGLRKFGWDIKDSKGTMFVWLRVPKEYTSIEFCEALLMKTGVVGTPGTAFGTRGEGYIRFALVKTVEELKEIAEIIGKSGLIK